MSKTTVLIVDDSALIRRMFEKILSEESDIEVVATAVDAYDAREKIKRFNPQVITLDIEMPRMDGLAFLEKIMSLRPMPVVMASTLTQKGADATLRALELGAVDYVAKPLGNHTKSALMSLREELVSKVRAAAKANLSRRRVAQPAHEPRVLSCRAPNPHLKMIAIGSSTGGVEALRDVFLSLPGNLPPIVMTQHMPEHFTASFAARLDQLSQVTVAEAYDGAPLKSGHAWLAPGSHHLRVARGAGGLVCRLGDEPAISGHRPSVDALFSSVAECVGAHALGVILTGMGRDGADGLLKMRQKGAHTIGQNQESCVVYGMPRVAFECGAVEMQCPLSRIAGQIVAACESTEIKKSNAI
jgi:two-component system chemotaxis response regulator CheB